MYTIVKQQPSEITVEHFGRLLEQRNESPDLIAAYISSGRGNLCVVHKITVDKRQTGHNYGFVNIGNPDYRPTYCANYMYESVVKAVKSGKKVIVFTSPKEMYEYMEDMS